MSQSPQILALDFDGVICNGLEEYFQTARSAYQQIWPGSSIADETATIFKQLRPVIETGWEMPVLLRAIAIDVPPLEIASDWATVRDRIVASEGIEPQKVGQQLDGVRDRWIEEDLEEWLSLHQFYPGIIDLLQSLIHSSIQLYIVTTKEGRFVQQLLRQQGVDLVAENIFGKEVKRPKPETLRRIIAQSSSGSQLFFVEDRFKTLEITSQQSDLAQVELFLADWGYNTESDRIAAGQHSRIRLISLRQFVCGDFDW